MKSIKNCHPEKILNELTSYAGVYQMFDVFGKILYIGKAKNLKNRLSTYFNRELYNTKTLALINKVCWVEVMVTQTEREALILENNLIKTHKPRYNILLKDDKSYPYIHISGHKYPRLVFYRGQKKEAGDFFGPFTSAAVVKENINLLKKIFRIRTCTDNVYKNRSRPCLEHQINLCSAPCVNYIDQKDYQNDVKMMKLFLSGKNQMVRQNILAKMQAAAKVLNFELAVHYRDQLQQLNQIQSGLANRIENTDIIAIAKYCQTICIQILFIRNNRQISQMAIFPKNPTNVSLEEVLSAFLPLYYLGKTSPKEMVLSHQLEQKELLEDALSTKIIYRPKYQKKQQLISATLNAKSKAKQESDKKDWQFNQLVGLGKLLNLVQLPTHIECFDISHMQGEATIASCVVFTWGKPQKSHYRQFNIKAIKSGDDYAAIKQAVYRRYHRLQINQQSMPNLVLIDGGIGQLNQALKVIKDLGLDIAIIGVAKGEGRKAGLETLIRISEVGEVQKIKLKPDDKVLMFINYIRDEAHRFAISKHRAKMKKTRQTSVLENITGVGVKKRQAVLNHFGGIIGVKKASIEELARVSGINQVLAEKVYQHFRKL